MYKIYSEEFLVELIHKYQNLVFSICYKLTNDYFAAQDLTQETFLSAYTHPESFQGGNEKAWICRIATNKCIDYEKKGFRKVVLSEEPLSKEGGTDTNLPLQAYMEKESRVRLLEECKKTKKALRRSGYYVFL